MSTGETRDTRNLETLAPDARGRALSTPNDAASEKYLFDAVLYPNRSLPPTGFYVVMGVIMGVAFFFSITFSALGAWPVVGFYGLDILAVYIAFRLSYRQGRLRERVRVTRDELLVSRNLPSGHEMRWRLKPFWTRVECEKPVRHDSQVRIVSKGKSLILGAFLSPEERGRFADALKDALGKARI
ncbi:MAG: DUF2244 domain-containing protein [Marinicaulis sp.]|nr:DUF2244 domain-containing protein [Marinicaulis sp.]NNL90104.1 DUF2244 domain-containing protein [Marinicaulis sp.]